MAEMVTTNFSFGELAPKIWGRIDIQQYQASAESLQNMIVLPHGAARKRPGTKYIADLESGGSPYPARLISFQTGPTTSYCVEVRHGNARILNSSGTQQATSAVTGFTTANMHSLKYVQSGLDMIFIDRTVAPIRLNFNGTSTWTFSTPSHTPPTPNPTFDTTTATKRPGAITFNDQRLVYGGTNEFENGLFGSKVQALQLFVDGTDAAIDFQATAAKTNAVDPYCFYVLDYGFIEILWLVTSSKLAEGVIVAGTTTGLYALRGSGLDGAIVPSGVISTRRQGVVGCSDIQGIVVNNYIMFVDATKRNIRVARFSLEDDQFITPGITTLSSHLFDSDIKEIHYQRAPYTILWVVLDSGKLLAFQSADEGGLAAWTPMDFGDARVYSMVVLPNEGEDDVLFVFERGASGSKTYTLEKLMPWDASDQDDFWFLDAGEQTDHGAAEAVGGVTLASGSAVTVTITGHPFANGEYVRFADVVGTTELNYNVYEIENKTTNTIDLKGTDGDDFTAWVSGGTAEQVAKTFTGLNHLNGETVSVWADGGVHADVAISGNSATLTRWANNAIFGRSYRAEIKTLPINAAQTRMKRIQKMFIRFYETIGAFLENEEGDTELVPFMEGGFTMGARPEPYTGLKEAPYMGRHTFDGQAIVYSETPTPFTVLSVHTLLEVYE